MIKKGIFYISILLTVAFISSGFKPYSPQINNSHLDENKYVNTNIPFKGKYFIGFKEAIAYKESQGKYNKINTLGYLGKYQFGMNTLKSIGINDSNSFIRNPKLQEKAFVTLLSKNKYELQDYISDFEGKVIDGVKITESGILAAAHLGGIGSVKRFLDSNGERKCKDEYGTSVRTYLKDFGGFETAGIIADKDAKIK